jgi:hypothetical protein
LTVLAILFAVLLAVVLYLSAGEDLDPPSSPNSPVRLQLAYARR